MVNPLSMGGRLVLVTGASSGIGRETATLLSGLGARLILTARDADRLEAAKSNLKAGPHVCEPFDVTNTAAIPGWMKDVAARHGPIHGLVHSAGPQLTRPLRITTPEQVESILRIHIGASLALARGFRQKDVCAAGGSIVFLSSAVGLVGEPARAAYSAAKAGIMGLTRSLAAELAPEAIRVNCVAPGVVRTPMWDETQRSLTNEQVAAIGAGHPLGLGEARDVANAIVFLLADTGRWITGSTLVVDGGYSAT